MTIFMLSVSGTLAAPAQDKVEKNKSEEQVATSWSKLNIEKRCEGLLKFFNQHSSALIPEWTLIKPQCVISGSVDQDLTWSFEASWQRGAKALPLRYVVAEMRLQKPRTTWCVVKGKKSACAAPWENGFSTGDLFPKKDAAIAAFQGILTLSPGFLTLASRLDEWVSKAGDELKIFDLTYSEWVRAWAKAPRSLPVKKEIFLAEFKVDTESPLTGLVKPKEQMPMELRECLGCAKTACEKSPISFMFWDLGLTVSRETTPEERQASGLKSGRASWVMMEPTPYVASVPKWLFLCGSHRMSVQKF